jgi:glutaryl-CoA dehydrogenase
LRYAQQRREFGEPLASFQIIRQRLVSMLADLTAMQLYCLQIGRLAEAGRRTPTVAGLAKMHNTRKARVTAADARHARRQRHPARLPGHAAPGGPGSDPLNS